MSPQVIHLLLALAYSAQFSYPLRIREWFVRAVGFVSTKEFIDALLLLLEQGRLTVQDGYVFPIGRGETIAVRERRLRASTQKRAELVPLINFLSKISWVEGVAITGSVALQNAEESDDIDLMIVTAQNRLWLVRPLVILFAFLKGKRRSWSREEKNSWCFNLWLERGTLQQPVHTRSLYIAYEVCQAEWLIDANQTKRTFFSVNRWVRHYLPRYYDFSATRTATYTKTSWQDWIIFGQLCSMFNLIAYALQRLYMARHMTRERVSLQLAFFHPRDTRRMISQDLHAIVAAWLKK